jgi:hypothetical protein
MSAVVPDARLKKAIEQFWDTRASQQSNVGGDTKQAYAGSRGSVVGGGHLDGFVSLVKELLLEGGLAGTSVHVSRSTAVLPGFFRPTKSWDLVVVDGGKLVAIVEFKSQVGSFGNNFNNRVEEALGNAADVHSAYREGAFAPSPSPWLGYLMLLEDCAESNSPVNVSEPHFKVFNEWHGASYAKRYEIFCRKLVRERVYDAACFVLSPRPKAGEVSYSEPSEEIGFANFAASLVGHALALAGTPNLAKRQR